MITKSSVPATMQSLNGDEAVEHRGNLIKTRLADSSALVLFIIHSGKTGDATELVEGLASEHKALTLIFLHGIKHTW